MAVFMFTVVMTTVFSLAAGDPTPADCVQTSPCKCDFSTGKTIDLSKIPGLSDDNQPWKEDILPTQGNLNYVYSFKPCYDFNEDDTVGGACNGVASCQKATPPGTDQFSLGDSKSAKFVMEDNDYKIKYSATDELGTTRTTFVTLKCTTDESFVVQGEVTTGNYEYILSSPAACRVLGGGSGGISVGTILCIIFLCVILFYVVGGILFMKFRKGAAGVELCPNLTFWKDLPNLIKDGACFSISPIRKKTEYSKM